VAIAATDLAEVLGMAIGIHLLTGIDLLWGVAITVFDTFLLLFLQRFGIRKMEAFIIGLVAVIGLSFLVEIILAKPNGVEIATGFVPRIPNNEALYIAIGIIGATVMPHNLYLHSALVQTRKIKKDYPGIRRALKWNLVDSTIALNLAFLVNAAILVLSATVFYKTGRTVVEIKEAHQLLEPILGSAIAPKLFAIALIASGQSSTITGTLAGQIVMEGYLRLRINPLVRRLITRLLAIIPAVIAIAVFGDKQVDNLLVLSQVILSLQLGFAIIPLIHFAANKIKMGVFAIGRMMRIAAWIIAGILVYLNIRMVTEQAIGYFENPGHFIWKTIIILAGVFFVSLLVYITLQPLFARKKEERPITIHPAVAGAIDLDIPVYHTIAIALEFSPHDRKLISSAIGQGKPDTTYLLIHVIESASAKVLGTEADDYESRKDEEQLETYKQQLIQRGYKVESRLGYSHRAKEIVRIVQQEKADLLVIGGHGHKGLQDFIHGETVNTVRHGLKIPVLVVHV
jgi:manganese transport protein